MSAIRLQALLTDGERPAASRAAAQLSAAGPVECAFLDADHELEQSESSLVLASLLAEMNQPEEPWPLTQTRLQARYRNLAEAGHRGVFICTIFRHVPGPRHAPETIALRLRINRLNLLAMELSRQLNLFVIDLDRDLAHVGARLLKTGYRLAGGAATIAAARTIALTLQAAEPDLFP